MIRDSYGLVLCGGQSTRMKTDKSLLTYFDQPQWQHVYTMLAERCAETFLSCNTNQQYQFGKEYPIIVDDNAFQNCGPMTSLLSAFAKFPHRDFLIVGCDYPFVTGRDLDDLLSSRRADDIACAFFKENENLYEPVLGWYSHRSRGALMERFTMQQFSLQHYLRGVNARKYIPLEINSMMSVDTPELMRESIIKLNRTYAGRGE